MSFHFFVFHGEPDVAAVAASRVPLAIGDTGWYRTGVLGWHVGLTKRGSVKAASISITYIKNMRTNLRLCLERPCIYALDCVDL